MQYKFGLILQKKFKEVLKKATFLIIKIYWLVFLRFGKGILYRYRKVL